jgi:altronate dehydratase small subunit
MFDGDEPALSSSSRAADGAARAPFVRLGTHDNVVVLTRHVDEGESFGGLDGRQWLMPSHLDVGNKLAAVPIAAGERVIKVGVPIGTATQAIAPGEHVHSHNLRSDYIATEVQEARNGEHSAD